MEPRLRTVASQVMLPMVTPSKVARVPNLRSTSVPLSSMLDGFDGIRDEGHGAGAIRQQARAIVLDASVPAR